MHRARIDIQIPVSLFILVPEKPDDIRPHQGRTLDLSSGGMLVQIDGMDKASYNRISAEVRVVRVSLQNTITGQNIQVRGSFTWYNYREAKGSSEPAYCRMGISFDEKDDVGLPAYSEFMNSLRLARDPLSN